MWFLSYQILALQLSMALARSTARSPSLYYGPISSKHSPSRHEQNNIILDIDFENFRELESESLGDEVLQIVSQIIPVALSAALKKADPSNVLGGVNDDGWNVVLFALTKLSSILWRDYLSFVGGSGGIDSSELWENACGDGKKDLAVWHGYKGSDGNKEGSNTIAICPSFFRKQKLFSMLHGGQIQECKDIDTRKLMESSSAILLQELSQTSHVDVWSRPRGNKVFRGKVTNPPEAAQKVLQQVNSKVEFEQVGVDLFALYTMLAWRRSLCE